MPFLLDISLFFFLFLSEHHIYLFVLCSGFLPAWHESGGFAVLWDEPKLDNIVGM